MNDQELDILMQRVLLDAIRRDEQKQSRATMPFMPTDRYRHSIAAMLRDPQAWAKKRARPLWKTVLQRAAVILLAASISLGSLMAISPRVRAAMIQWVTEWYEEHITFRFAGEEIAGAMPQYEITNLPEGYVETQYLTLPNMVSIEYLCEDGGSSKGINLTYIYMQDGSASDFKTEDAETIPITVNGLKGQLFLKNGLQPSHNTVTWIDSEKNIQFEVSAYMGREDILQIAESVSLIK